MSFSMSGGPVWILYLVIYAYFAFSLMTIANKLNQENSWYAWIPILNIYLMCLIAGKPGWWVVLSFIPLVNIIILIILWMAIAEERGFPSWWGILLIVPLVNLIVPGYLAFAEP